MCTTVRQSLNFSFGQWATGTPASAACSKWWSLCHKSDCGCSCCFILPEVFPFAIQTVGCAARWDLYCMLGRNAKLQKAGWSYCDQQRKCWDANGCVLVWMLNPFFTVYLERKKVKEKKITVCNDASHKNPQQTWWALESGGLKYRGGANHDQWGPEALHKFKDPTSSFTLPSYYYYYCYSSSLLIFNIVIIDIILIIIAKI